MATQFVAVDRVHAFILDRLGIKVNNSEWLHGEKLRPKWGVSMDTLSQRSLPAHKAGTVNGLQRSTVVTGCRRALSQCSPSSGGVEARAKGMDAVLAAAGGLSGAQPQIAKSHIIAVCSDSRSSSTCPCRKSPLSEGPT